MTITQGCMLSYRCRVPAFLSSVSNWSSIYHISTYLRYSVSKVPYVHSIIKYSMSLIREFLSTPTYPPLNLWCSTISDLTVAFTLLEVAALFVKSVLSESDTPNRRASTQNPVPSGIPRGQKAASKPVKVASGHEVFSQAGTTHRLRRHYTLLQG